MTHPQPEQKRGYTLMELTLVMLLLALFAITVMVLIQSGSTAYRKIADNRSAETNARVALSYLDVRLRQNDAQGALSLRENPLGEGNALVIHEEYDGFVYDTWVYFLDGTLYECSLLDEGDMPRVDISAPIAQLDGYTLELLPGGTILQTASITYADSEGTDTEILTSLLTPRSGELAP